LRQLDAFSAGTVTIDTLLHGVLGPGIVRKIPTAEGAP
jgi:hypothetical protein